MMDFNLKFSQFRCQREYVISGLKSIKSKIAHLDPIDNQWLQSDLKIVKTIILTVIDQSAIIDFKLGITLK